VVRDGSEQNQRSLYAHITPVKPTPWVLGEKGSCDSRSTWRFPPAPSLVQFGASPPSSLAKLLAKPTSISRKESSIDLSTCSGLLIKAVHFGFRALGSESPYGHGLLAKQCAAIVPSPCRYRTRNSSCCKYSFFSLLCSVTSRHFPTQYTAQSISRCLHLRIFIVLSGSSFQPHIAQRTGSCFIIRLLFYKLLLRNFSSACLTCWDTCILGQANLRC
jgi:hypothetical protein